MNQAGFELLNCLGQSYLKTLALIEHHQYENSLDNTLEKGKVILLGMMSQEQ